jgi:putative ABC transport system ATP-binding protein
MPSPAAQQQRVAIARALANRPEPPARGRTYGRARRTPLGRQVMELFRKRRPRAAAPAYIVVTHDHRALDVFDRSLEMEDGMLVPSHTVRAST